MCVLDTFIYSPSLLWVVVIALPMLSKPCLSIALRSDLHVQLFLEKLFVMVKMNSAVWGTALEL